MSELAHRLVYEYKDHGFAIDAHEAAELFGSEVVGMNTPQYGLANRMYKTFDLLERIVGSLFNRHFAFTGRASDGCHIPKKKTS